jgi:hypothetical protein
VRDAHVIASPRDKPLQTVPGAVSAESPRDFVVRDGTALCSLGTGNGHAMMTGRVSAPVEYVVSAHPLRFYRRKNIGRGPDATWILAFVPTPDDLENRLTGLAYE